MMRKLERMADELNEGFKGHLKAAMQEHQGVEVETHFDLFGSMRHVTRRKDGEDFTPEQRAFLAGWSEGYTKVMELVREADHG